MIVDVFGWFTGPSAASPTDGLFVPGRRRRASSTPAPTTTRSVRSSGCTPAGPWRCPSSAAAASRSTWARSSANTTIVNTRGAGFTTVYPAGTPRPLASNLNATDSAQLIANHTIVPVGVRGVAFYSQKRQPHRRGRHRLVHRHAAAVHARCRRPTRRRRRRRCRRGSSCPASASTPAWRRPTASTTSSTTPATCPAAASRARPATW